jgi:two-component system cell cycle sensor histidine kinase/response regulator CckA
MSVKEPPEGNTPDKDIQAQKLESLGRFAGGIAHDFNNILSIIEGHTQQAIKALKDGKLTAEQLQKILLSTQRGAGLTRQLLAFGRQKISVDETIDIVDFLQRESVLLSPVMGDKITSTLELPEGPLWVMASEDQIGQILLNLALNARDALPNGGNIDIKCSVENGSVRLSVRDNGEGIKSSVLPHIFDPFFTTKGQSKGTGLGLAVVYGIVDQLRGKIEVTSKVHEGTIFTVTMPQAEAPENYQPASLEGKTILLAEDEPELRDILGVMLTGFGMKVLEASNGNHAMELQHDYAGSIDFLLTDVVMPEMDGHRLGKLFTVRRPDTNVIYMSGYPFLDSGEEKPFPDESTFIPKPLQEETVRQVLERALQMRDERLKNEKPPE